MKKAFDQTFRDIKRGVNKKVLKVPSIEQKVLDATSNEPWGPHGTHLADIAQASRNYHEYQMIMSVVWKRLGDTGKNWRHVFKGLTVLEYMVVNGSERVIEDIREHAYQITALSAFQYIDSTGRDQGSNVRKKSQLLVALVNDKEKLQEAREKANASREKFRNTGNDRYEGRYGNRDEDRNGYGREREWGDDESRGRSRSSDGDYGPRSRSSDREREQSFEDDGHRSSRGSNGRVEDASPDASRIEPKLSGQSVGAPPSYEDVVTNGHSPDTKRDGETATAFASKPSSPQVNINHQETLTAAASPTPAAATPPPVAATPPPPAVTPNNENDGFDFFDPRGAAPALPPAASGGTEMDLLGSLSDSFSSNALALVPSTSITTEVHPPTNTNPFDTASAGVASQPFDDPFGDGPFRAIPSTDGFSAQPPTSPFTTSAEPPTISVDPTSGSGPNLGFGDTFDQSFDILADILPPSGPPSTQTAFPSQNGQPPADPNQTTFPSSFTTPFGQPPSFSSQGEGGQPMPHHAFQPQGAQSMPFPSQGGQPMPGGHQSTPQSAFQPQGSQSMPFPPQGGQPMPGGHQSTPQSALQLPGSHQSAPQSALQVPGGQQPMPQSVLQLLGGHQSMPQSALQVQGGHQSMPQSAFQVSGVQQSMSQSALQVQGGHQSMPQSAFQVPGAQQSMPQSTLQVQDGQQSMPQSAYQVPGAQQSMPQQTLQVQGGHQSMLQSAFQVPSAQQSMPQSTLQVQGGHQSIPQPSFPAQGGRSVLQPAFLAQGGQTGFAPQGSQNASLGGFSSQLGSLSQTGFPSSNGQSVLQSAFPAQGDQSVLQPGKPTQSGQSPFQPGFLAQGGQNASLGGFPSNGQLAQPNVSQAGFTNSNGQPNNLFGGFQPQSSSASVPPLSQATATPAPQYNASNFYQQQQSALTASTGALALVPQQATDKKFETKSTVWADTLNRGLVNLNISGSKTNPLSDIGIDFEAINRKEKRMEKPSKTPVTSNVSMGKAMGSGSGMGRAGAGVLRPAPNPMVGPGMGAPGGFGGVNQSMGMNHMPQNMGIGMGMGMGMNTGQGFQMQPGFPPGSANYNPMIGRGAGYGQQPYGGYR